MPANELALWIRRYLTDQGFDVIVLVEVAKGRNRSRST